jgi:hypothetical protein
MVDAIQNYQMVMMIWWSAKPSDYYSLEGFM